MIFHEQLIFLLRVLCAEILVFGLLYVSYACAHHIIGRTASVTLRWCAVVTTGIWIVSVAFNLLLFMNQFTLVSAILLMGACVLLVMIFGMPVKVFLHFIRKDCVQLKRIYRLNRMSPYRWFFLVYAVFALLTFLRTTIIPLLGWDSLTYHGVKAGMWVQNDGPTTLVSPGGWGQYHRNFFGGGEVFTAWAMLPFHSDVLAGTVDAVQWLLLGLMLYALGQELGVRPRFRLVGVAYVLYIPALWLSVGSGYVEPGLLLMVMSGLLFAIRFLSCLDGRFMLMSLMALGVAGGIKITALPILLVVCLILFGTALFTGSHRIVLVKWILVSSLACALVVSPWFVRNIQQTGYPLASMPVSIAGITLGKATKTIEWYQNRPGLKSYDFFSEMNALRKMFLSPFQVSPHLSWLTVLPAFVFLSMVILWLRHRKKIAILMIGMVGVVLASFYHPGFSAVRLLWPHVSGRFLLPVLCPAVVVSFLWCKPHGKGANVYALFLLVGTMIHIARCAFYGWAPFEKGAVFVELVVTLMLMLVIRYFIVRDSGQIMLLGTAIVVPLVILPLLNAYRYHTRYKAALQSVVLHPVLPVYKYWIPAAQLLDERDVPLKIAVTAGPRQDADNWFMYFFMGRKLQNQLVYIPITKNGNILDFGPDGEMERNGDIIAWLNRVRINHITYVMSFAPRSLELLWMEKNPMLFKRLTGDGNIWGLYRVQDF